MLRLIRADFLRRMKNKIVWLAVIITVCMGIYSGYYNGGHAGVLEFIVFAVLLSWMTGRENRAGSFHNKILAGYTRTQIYFSEILCGCVICGILFLIAATIYACFNWMLEEEISAFVMVGIFIASLLVNLAMAAILVTVNCLIPNRYIAVVASILLVLVMDVFSQLIFEPSQTEPYRTETDYVWVQDEEENTWEEVAESEYRITQEDEKRIAVNIIYAIITLPAVCLGGCLLFRKRQFE